MFIKGTVLSNPSNLRKLYLVNIDPETWETTDMVYRQPEHWQAVTVRPVHMHTAQTALFCSTLHCHKLHEPVVLFQQLQGSNGPMHRLCILGMS